MVYGPIWDIFLAKDGESKLTTSQLISTITPLSDTHFLILLIPLTRYLNVMSIIFSLGGVSIRISIISKV